MLAKSLERGAESLEQEQRVLSNEFHTKYQERSTKNK